MYLVRVVYSIRARTFMILLASICTSSRSMYLQCYFHLFFLFSFSTPWRTRGKQSPLFAYDTTTRRCRAVEPFRRVLVLQSVSAAACHREKMKKSVGLRPVLLSLLLLTSRAYQPTGRRTFFAAVYGTAANIFGADAALSVGFPEQKSYSSNGRNLDRLSVGDRSGGSVYDNDPKSPGAAKRRAMLGCKIPSARLRAGMESERECNLRVLDGDSEFMLKVLRKLECPSCPYGIEGA